MFALGIAMLLYGLLGANFGVMAEGLDLSVRNAAQEAADNMTDDDVRRVFDMPPQVADRHAWLETHFGRSWSRAIRGYIPTINLAAAGLGIILCIWGACEWGWRPRACLAPPPQT